MDHMIRNNLFSKRQYGFLGGRSTILQLLCAIDNWTTALEESKTVDCIYADFKKAFDKVPHRRLMTKVRAYGIKDNICNWIEDFLKDRQQRVSVNGSVSSWEKDNIRYRYAKRNSPWISTICLDILPFSEWIKWCRNMSFLYVITSVYGQIRVSSIIPRYGVLRLSPNTVQIIS